MKDVDAADIEKIQNFKEEMRVLIREWYEGCPRPLQFISKVIKLYKEYFGNDYAAN